MPTYTTPTAIDLAIDLSVGAINVVASDRGDTVITVSPSNSGNENDRRGAEGTTVEFDGERLTINGPRPRLAWIGPNASVDLHIEAPTASRLSAKLAVGGVRTTGRLGATRIKCATGTVGVDTSGDLWLRISHGNASVAAIDGTAEIKADMGQLRIGSVTGDAIVSASHGSVTIGESSGAVDAKLSYGDFEIARANDSVSAKTAYGSITLGEVSSGTVELDSGMGPIAVGVRAGVPAWLDLSSKSGQVRNHLDGDGAPVADERTVSVRARTRLGDIQIHRAA